MSDPSSLRPPEAGAPSFGFSETLVALSSEPRPEAESFRALRTHLVAQHLQEGRRALAICGPSAGVGCTTLAANLAVSLAQIGVNTLLVDGNLRQPGLEQLFRPNRTVRGLSECLSQARLGLSEAICEDVLPNLSIMFAGQPPANPQELLGSARFEELMGFCLRDYEMTIMDTPPANRCSDGRLISRVLGYSLVVSRQNKSLLADVRLLISQLEADHAQVVGTVLTEA